MLAVERVTGYVVIYLPHQERAVVTLLPDGSKVIGSPRRLALPSWPHAALAWASHRGQEVGSGLLVGADKPKLLEILTGA